MADYREHYPKIRAAGAGVVAISVDPPVKSEALRRALQLPFSILCDTERRVVQDWGIYNPREKGGIAKPAVFVIDGDRTVRYCNLDHVATRVPASEIVRVLGPVAGGQPLRRKVCLPQFGDFLRALRNKSSRLPS